MTEKQVLQYGGYSVSAELAVENSFLLSTAEVALMRCPFDRMEIAEILLEYIEGRTNLPEAVAALNEDLDND